MITVPATELAIRDWLRQDSAILALVGNDQRKIDADYSGDEASTHMTIRRAGGGTSSTLPFDRALMVFDCWGRGRGAALNLATALVQKLVNAKEEQLNATAYLRGCQVESNMFVPDPTGQARYVVMAMITVTARQAA